MEILEICQFFIAVGVVSIPILLAILLADFKEYLERQAENRLIDKYEHELERERDRK